MKEYEIVCRKLAKEFADKYFGKQRELWYIGDDPTGVIYINDNFFEISECYQFLKYKFSQKKMFAYMDYKQECYEKDITPMNIYSFKKLRK